MSNNRAALLAFIGYVVVCAVYGIIVFIRNAW